MRVSSLSALWRHQRPRRQRLRLHRPDCIDRIPSAVFVEPDDNAIRHPPLENPILAFFRRRRRNQGPDPFRELRARNRVTRVMC